MTRAWRRLDRLMHLVRRDFAVRYQGSALGVLWTLALPLTHLVVLVFLFRRVVPLGIDDYPAFVLCALLPWAWFSTCLGNAGTLFVGNRDLVRHPDFAPATLVAVSTMASLVSYAASLPVLLAVTAWYGSHLSWTIVALPLLLLVQGVLVQGLGLIVATLNVFWRDVQHLAGVIVSLLFYLTPVFYDATQLDARYRTVLALNPMTPLVEGHRAIFLGGQLPAWRPLLLAALSSTVILGVGHLVYTRSQHDLVDAI